MHTHTHGRQCIVIRASRSNAHKSRDLGVNYYHGSDGADASPEGAIGPRWWRWWWCRCCLCAHSQVRCDSIVWRSQRAGVWVCVCARADGDFDCSATTTTATLGRIPAWFSSAWCTVSNQTHGKYSLENSRIIDLLRKHTTACNVCNNME